MRLIRPYTLFGSTQGRETATTLGRMFACQSVPYRFPFHRHAQIPGLIVAGVGQRPTKIGIALRLFDG